MAKGKPDRLPRDPRSPQPEENEAVVAIPAYNQDQVQMVGKDQRKEGGVG